MSGGLGSLLKAKLLLGQQIKTNTRTELPGLETAQPSRSSISVQPLHVNVKAAASHRGTTLGTGGSSGHPEGQSLLLPDRFQASLNGFRGYKVCGNIMDFMRQAETHFQPVVDM